ncbi:hypothetical protein SAMD00019534_056880 [Acytostelium subglobosum LB1]|uniref:hypothetical protein n=1 Tax=Acytostelium subglobosum LB1 TaxID=1410327 RepID=UPI000645206C|nr:hypothetical protein SAMD00019534_056880 [Acytostelium subglobosum LB1]GAM22513.1 hypothetical protein SAMD00019534_056880 [Acytostelium subglobosum LB1]|eukprot:XP_012754633.1 hypothetical protein SAMD00019534_056880 [Acytostelium subglobosum LB1]
MVTLEFNMTVDELLPTYKNFNPTKDISLLGPSWNGEITRKKRKHRHKHHEDDEDDTDKEHDVAARGANRKKRPLARTVATVESFTKKAGSSRRQSFANNRSLSTPNLRGSNSRVSKPRGTSPYAARKRKMDQADDNDEDGTTTSGWWSDQSFDWITITGDQTNPLRLRFKRVKATTSTTTTTTSTSSTTSATATAADEAIKLDTSDIRDDY